MLVPNAHHCSIINLTINNSFKISIYRAGSKVQPPSDHTLELMALAHLVVYL